MQIKRFDIQNFRKLKSCKIELSNETTVFVGANNSGKTSIIELFKRLFRDRNFTKEDISAEYYSKLQHDFKSIHWKGYCIQL